MLIRLIAGLIKTISLYKINFYPEPGSYSRSKIKDELDLSNCTAKFEVKRIIRC